MGCATVALYVGLMAREPAAIQLVVAIVQHEDAKGAVEAMTQGRFRVTQLATSGGFLRKGNVTLLVGVERARLSEVLRVLGSVCETRTEHVMPLHVEAMPGTILFSPMAVQVGGATVFVMDVQHFERV